MSEREQRMIVGVDGSPGSRAALRWAIRHAEKLGSELTAVIAWAPPVYFDVAALTPGDDPDKRAERELRKTIDETSALLGAHVPVRQEVVRGLAAKVLLDAAQGADLLVVGSRGRGGFAGALLGSVSQHCVHHAACPVVVVRGEWSA